MISFIVCQHHEDVVNQIKGKWNALHAMCLSVESFLRACVKDFSFSNILPFSYMPESIASVSPISL